MRLMVTAGGTGGHISPAVAVIEELQQRDPRLVVRWVGRRKGLEARMCETLSIPFRSVPVEGWPRAHAWRKPWAAAKLAAGAALALAHIRRFRPQVVLGMGGYVSVPLMWVAQRLGAPTVLHEQNKRLGLANRILAKRAHRLLLSYPETIGEFPRERSRVVGNPVRAGFSRAPDPAAARAKLGFEPDRPLVLFVGGSQGARTLNQAVTESLQLLEPGTVQILWMTGGADVAEARLAAEAAPVAVHAVAFIDDMVTACTAPDIIVSRAGASSTAEIATLGKPSLLVPYPYAADNHQEENARAFEAAGAAIVLKDDQCSGTRLTQVLKGLLDDRSRLEHMAAAARTLAKPGAAETIADEILALAFEEARPGNRPAL
ncbi:MAG TPA: undecaprenyldiphospho-muramoylpentapeptide beta-N-acetylglucosaminyltransferase [Candidatus Hydrogenedentes bacterium]|nr:undecaprenyldiphospho-muramoylpentapeptide beta-N-acetylglucosaminyltransferase [Candidatus Hydrogenedentota bacterium]HIJ74546.1 undecaprenyldiphospho-muramoylpentapeptide beta-N-acetylglucosaminyltransferase [Candidatus Hydrogenedentota bacterium]